MSTYAIEYIRKNGECLRDAFSSNPYEWGKKISCTKTIRKDVGTQLIEYTQFTKLDAEYVLGRVKFFLEEDIQDGDKTTLGTVSPDEKVTAEIQAVESLVFSGKEVILHCFDDDSAVHIHVKDGDELMPEMLLDK